MLIQSGHNYSDKLNELLFRICDDILCPDTFSLLSEAEQWQFPNIAERKALDKLIKEAFEFAELAKKNAECISVTNVTCERWSYLAGKFTLIRIDLIRYNCTLSQLPNFHKIQ